MLAAQKGIGETEIMNHLKTLEAPGKYELLFFAGKLSVSELIQTIEEWEMVKAKRAHQAKISEARKRIRKKAAQVARKKEEQQGACFTCRETVQGRRAMES